MPWRSMPLQLMSASCWIWRMRFARQAEALGQHLQRLGSRSRSP